MKKRVSDRLRRPVHNHHLVVVGNLEGKDDFVVNGHVIGNSDVQGAILLTPDSHWKGNITADVVIIKGSVEGHVWARRRLEIGAGGRVVGDLKGPDIAIAEGAQLRGEVLGESRVLHFRERRYMSYTP